jgi:nickel-dependent lactate racemase
MNTKGSIKVEFNYGPGKIGVEIPARNLGAVLKKPEMPRVENPGEAVRKVLDMPTAGVALKELCSRKKTACVVVSDITRPVPNRAILPVLLPYLEEHGIRRKDIRILVGTGMHRPNLGEELEELVGAEVVKNYQVINHDAHDEKSLLDLGRTKNGTRIQVNRAYVEADLKILTGLIEPHFMAGYSGGRKAICPGIMGPDTFRFSHGVECLAHPSATNCVLEGNPFHQEAVEVAKKAGCDFLLNVVIDEGRNISGIFTGELIDAHQAGCSFIDRYVKVQIEDEADIVVTSNAGSPLDINLYQTVKGLVAALPAVKDGGTIIMLSRCREGLGSEAFVGLLKELEGIGDGEEFLKNHSRPENFVEDQWEVQELLKVLDKARYYIYSEGITEDEAGLSRGTKISSPEEGLALALEEHGEGARIIAIPEGPYLIPELKEAL